MSFSGGWGNQAGPLIILLILVTFVVASVFGGYRRKKAGECLVRLASGPSEAACPVTGKPYPPGGVARCPEPAGHLPSDPRFEHGRFRQALPAAESGTDFPVSDWRVFGRLETSGAGPVVTLRPRFWWKYGAGPLLMVGGLAFLVALVRAIVSRLRTAGRDAGLIALGAVLAAIVLAPTAAVVLSIWGETTIEFDAAAREVRKTFRVAGLRAGSPSVFKDPKALAPSAHGAVILVHGQAGPEILFSIDPGRLGALVPLHEALFR